MLNTERIKKKMPDQKTAPSAVCHGTPMPSTAVYVKKALRPIPGATIMGLRAYRPMSNELKKHTSTVAVSTPANGSPALLKMAGFTTIIYAVAKKLETPAITSV